MKERAGHAPCISRTKTARTLRQRKSQKCPIQISSAFFNFNLVQRMIAFVRKIAPDCESHVIIFPHLVKKKSASF